MRSFLSLLLFVSLPLISQAAEPLKVLIITGGCCHDYDHQGQVIARGIRDRCNARCTVLQEIDNGTAGKISLYENPDWAKGYDVVIHDECFADVKEVSWLEKVLKPHKAGVPAVVLHCAMHCYRAPTDEWFKFCGITSPGHGAHYAFDVKNKKPDHPIMKGFGEKWSVPKDELYFCNKVWPTAEVLGEAFSTDRKADQACIWTNQYGNTRVFGTTLAHYTENVASKPYLDLVTNGMLWACGKLGDDGKPSAGYRK